MRILISTTILFLFGLTVMAHGDSGPQGCTLSANTKKGEQVVFRLRQDNTASRYYVDVTKGGIDITPQNEHVTVYFPIHAYTIKGSTGLFGIHFTANVYSNSDNNGSTLFGLKSKVGLLGKYVNLGEVLCTTL